jgi:hypothetical protein
MKTVGTIAPWAYETALSRIIAKWEHSGDGSYEVLEELADQFGSLDRMEPSMDRVDVAFGNHLAERLTKIRRALLDAMYDARNLHVAIVKHAQVNDPASPHQAAVRVAMGRTQ